MRAEKGFIMIGDETDGTVTPQDLGLGWAVSKKKPDFIGKRAQERPDLARPDRKQLVGLLTEDPADGAARRRPRRGRRRSAETRSDADDRPRHLDLLLADPRALDRDGRWSRAAPRGWARR